MEAVKKSARAEHVPPAGSPRTILTEWLQWSGLTQAELAERAGLTERAIRHFLKGTQGLGVPSLAALSGAFGKDPAPLLEAVGDAIDRRKFLQFVAAVAAVARHCGLTQEQDRAPSEAVGELALSLPLEVWAEIGVVLERSERLGEAAAVLGYLVDPRGPAVLLKAAERTRDRGMHLAAAVAIAHFGHLELSRGESPQLAVRCYQDALELLGEADPWDWQERERWERWQRVSTLSRKHFELGCFQMIGVAKRAVGGKRELEEGVTALTYVIDDATSGQEEIPLVRGNALRDLANLKIDANPAVAAIEAHLNESVGVLADTPASDMLGMSLLRRAAWRKEQRSLLQAEADAVAGLQLVPDVGILRCIALNSVAELYADLEPALARRLALEARRRASLEGYGDQERRAETLLGGGVR
jgi:transcriptional regulator with XRE-family HTH domain